MPLQVDERRLARVVVARRVEVEAVPLAGADVALRAELRAGAGEREVDVEEDGAELSSSSQLDDLHVRVDDVAAHHATVCAIVQPRARSRSSPSSAQSRSSR